MSDAAQGFSEQRRRGGRIGEAGDAGGGAKELVDALVEIEP